MEIVAVILRVIVRNGVKRSNVAAKALIVVDSNRTHRFNLKAMAKPLVFSFNGVDLPFALEKVERSDLYGFIEIETLDEQGRKCSLATLADDGRSVIGPGGISLVTLSPEGNWLQKKACIPTDNQGKKVEMVPSSYSAPVPLSEVVSIEEFLNHDIRAVYQISSDADFGSLMSALTKGTIYRFPYSFRGGLEPDAGFLLLAADGTPFMAVGSPTKLEFVGFEQAAGIAEDDAGDDDDSLDFGMM